MTQNLLLVKTFRLIFNTFYDKQETRQQIATELIAI